MNSKSSELSELLFVILKVRSNILAQLQKRGRCSCCGLHSKNSPNISAYVPAELWPKLLSPTSNHRHWGSLPLFAGANYYLLVREET